LRSRFKVLVFFNLRTAGVVERKRAVTMGSRVKECFCVVGFGRSLGKCWCSDNADLVVEENVMVC